MNKNLKTNINDILRELGERKRNKEELFQMYVRQRLDNSLKVYYSELMSDANSLFKYDPNEVLKIFIKKQG